MNYLSHGRHALGRPWELAGTALPDWLRRLHRRLRFSAAQAQELRAHARDPRLVALADGVLRNHEDDLRFHTSRAFLESTAEVTRELRAVTADQPRFRPSVVAHLLVEMLLDATLEETRPGTLAQYYEDLHQVDGQWLEQAIVPLAQVLGSHNGDPPPSGLAHLVERFRSTRFLEAYATDDGLCTLLDAVLQRARLQGLPDRVTPLLPGFRRLVRERADELLG